MPSHDGELAMIQFLTSGGGRVGGVAGGAGLQANVCSGLFCGSETGSSLL